MDASIFRGCVPAIMTPCQADGTPNHPALLSKAQQLTAAGMHAVGHGGSKGA